MKKSVISFLPFLFSELGIPVLHKQPYEQLHQRRSVVYQTGKTDIVMRVV